MPKWKIKMVTSSDNCPDKDGKMCNNTKCKSRYCSWEFCPRRKLPGEKFEYF